MENELHRRCGNPRGQPTHGMCCRGRFFVVSCRRAYSFYLKSSAPLPLCGTRDVSSLASLGLSLPRVEIILVAQRAVLSIPWDNKSRVVSTVPRWCWASRGCHSWRRGCCFMLQRHFRDHLATFIFQLNTGHSAAVSSHPTSGWQQPLTGDWLLHLAYSMLSPQASPVPLPCQLMGLGGDVLLNHSFNKYLLSRWNAKFWTDPTFSEATASEENLIIGSTLWCSCPA